MGLLRCCTITRAHQLSSDAFINHLLFPLVVTWWDYFRCKIRGRSKRHLYFSYQTGSVAGLIPKGGRMNIMTCSCNRLRRAMSVSYKIKRAEYLHTSFAQTLLVARTSAGQVCAKPTNVSSFQSSGTRRLGALDVAYQRTSNIIYGDYFFENSRRWLATRAWEHSACCSETTRCP
jgi:hypothetical protein